MDLGDGDDGHVLVAVAVYGKHEEPVLGHDVLVVLVLKSRVWLSGLLVLQ